MIRNEASPNVSSEQGIKTKEKLNPSDVQDNMEKDIKSVSSLRNTYPLDENEMNISSILSIQQIQGDEFENALDKEAEMMGDASQEKVLERIEEKAQVKFEPRSVSEHIRKSITDRVNTFSTGIEPISKEDVETSLDMAVFLASNEEKYNAIKEDQMKILSSEAKKLFLEAEGKVMQDIKNNVSAKVVTTPLVKLLPLPGQALYNILGTTVTLQKLSKAGQQINELGKKFPQHGECLTKAANINMEKLNAKLESAREDQTIGNIFAN